MTDISATEKIEVTCRPCMVCGNKAVMIVNRAAYFRWRAGDFVQEAFPELSTSEREQLVSGTHPHCWDILWAGESDD